MARVIKTGLIVFVPGFIFFACKEDVNAPAANEAPEIELIQAPPSVYQFPAQPAGVHVRVRDAQGVSDLAGVTLMVKRADGSVTNTRELTDDGRQGDILSGDGQFFTSIDTALLRNQTGSFMLEAIARDQSQNQSAPVSAALAVLGGVENRLPSILEVVVPQSVHLDTEYVFIFSAAATDPDGAHTVQFVLMETYPPAFAQPTRTDTLRDNGQDGDSQAADGIFTVGLPGQMIGTQCGLYSLAFRPVDDTNGTGPAVLQTLRATRLALENNTPPRVSDLIAPATISRSATPNLYVLSIRAEDPDAACDDAITRVFFNSFLPNGNGSSSNPFALRDDGQEGDAVAGDGRYSLTIQVPVNAELGTYRFEYQAQDRSGALSEKLIRTITVTP